MGGPEPGEGVASYHGNVKNTERWNAAFAFLDPVRDNPNLTIWDHTMVDKVVIEGARAEALIVKYRGEMWSFGQTRYCSQRGPRDASDFDEVGGGAAGGVEGGRSSGVSGDRGCRRNLHDHPSFYISYKPTDEGWERVVRDLGEDSVYRGQVILRARSPVCQEDLPFDLHLLPSQVPRTLESRTLQGFVCHMASRSRGRVWITSRDPNAAPRIATNYLTDEGSRDTAALIYALRLLRRVAQAAPMSSLIESELEPWGSKQTDEEILGQLRESIVNYSHASGRARWGLPRTRGRLWMLRGRCMDRKPVRCRCLDNPVNTLGQHESDEHADWDEGGLGAGGVGVGFTSASAVWVRHSFFDPLRQRRSFSGLRMSGWV